MSASVFTLLSNSIKHFLKNYATFAGRTPRKLYWPTPIFNFLLLFFLSIPFIASCIFDPPSAGHSLPLPLLLSLIVVVIVYIWLLVLFIPNLAASARRLHDIGLSGWWQLPVFAVQLLVSPILKLCGLSPIHTLILSYLPSAIVSIVFLIVLCRPSQPGTNKYGPPPQD